MEMKLELNPLDPKDVEILKVLKRLCKSPETEVEADLTEFGERLALLLKYDWERAKWEASSLVWRLIHFRKSPHSQEHPAKAKMEGGA